MAVSSIGSAGNAVTRDIRTESGLASTALLHWLVADLAICAGARLAGISRSEHDGLSRVDQAGVAGGVHTDSVVLEVADGACDTIISSQCMAGTALSRTGCADIVIRRIWKVVF